MPRIRTIKPDAFTSDSLSRVPRGVRWTFAGLWTYIDDEGRGRDDIRLIKAALYALDDEVNLSVLANDLNLLAGVGCICRYEAEGRTYLHVPRWQHQRINRPSASTYPACPREHDMNNHGALTEPSVSDHGGISEGSREERKGKEGKGKEQGTRKRAATSPDTLFDDFWAAYPRKTDKGNARKAWDKALKKTTAETLIRAAGALAAAKPDPKFTAHPSTWLNGERWDDQPLTLLPGGMQADGSRSQYAADDVRNRFK